MHKYLPVTGSGSVTLSPALALAPWLRSWLQPLALEPCDLGPGNRPDLGAQLFALHRPRPQAVQDGARRDAKQDGGLFHADELLSHACMIARLLLVTELSRSRGAAPVCYGPGSAEKLVRRRAGRRGAPPYQGREEKAIRDF
jgi:hypothetical protein